MSPDELNEALAGKRALITGGLGMIGSTLAHKLVAANAEVILVDAMIEPYGANLFNIHGIDDHVRINIADVRDREAMKVLVQGVDYIFNLAGQVSHNDSIQDPFLDADINYIGHLNVVENVRRHNPTAKILYSGSRLQFGPIDSVPVDESQVLNPKTPYAFNKTVAENMYRYYYELHGIPFVAFRIANPYGVRAQMKHHKYTIINFFIRQAMEGKELTVFGEGTQLRDYIYVEDLADAFLLAAVNDDATGEVFNVGSGEGTVFRDMVEAVVAEVGNGKVTYVPWPESYINVETGDYITDIGKVTSMLGWEPTVSLKEGIARTVAYYRQHGEHYF